jgi:hypothetical protein
MNQGAQRARGRILWFLHADTRIDQTCLDLIRQAFLEVGPRLCGAFDLTIDAGAGIFRIIESVASWRSRVTGVPYGDQAVFMTRRAFETAGGFPDIPIMEDVAMMGRLRKRGMTPHIFRHRVVTSGRRWRAQGTVYTTLRNWLLITLFLLGVPPERLVRYY